MVEIYELKVKNASKPIGERLLWRRLGPCCCVDCLYVSWSERRRKRARLVVWLAVVETQLPQSLRETETDNDLRREANSLLISEDLV